MPAAYSSQQCAQCGDRDKKNRKSQSEFLCLKCGHTDNADNNATKVIKQRTFEYLRSKAFLNGKTKRKIAIRKKAVQVVERPSLDSKGDVSPEIPATTVDA